MIAICDNCEKQYKTIPSWYKRSRHHYCGRGCSSAANYEQNRRNLEAGAAHRFKKGHIPSPNRKMQSGNDHYAWKGDDVSYRGLHYWLRRVKGNPIQCSSCGSAKNIQWASINGEYPRDPDNFIELCASCHKKHDIILATRDGHIANQ
jgi:hypothetical protein